MNQTVENLRTNSFSSNSEKFIARMNCNCTNSSRWRTDNGFLIFLYFWIQTPEFKKILLLTSDIWWVKYLNMRRFPAENNAFWSGKMCKFDLWCESYPKLSWNRNKPPSGSDFDFCSWSLTSGTKMTQCYLTVKLPKKVSRKTLFLVSGG